MSQKSESSLENLESEGMIPHLPQEIRLNILFRLPVEGLIRCTSVRKSWRTVIKDQSFIGDYNSCAKNSAIENGTQLLLVHGTAFTFEVERGIVSGALLGHEVYSLHYDDPTFLEHSRIRVPVVPRWNICFRVAGICDGIVLLADDVPIYGYNFILCNPFLRKSVILPHPNVTFETHGLYEASVGFGHDAMKNDYKVVMLASLLDELPGSESRTVVEVYSLVAHSWKDPQIAPLIRIEGRARAAFFDGALHWPASRRENNNCCNFILVFDVSTESFRPEIMMPESVRTLVEVKSLELSLSSDQKSIALFVEDADVLQVWVLNDYGRPESWTLLMQEAPFTSLCFMRSGELLLADDLEGYYGLLSQKPVSRERRRLEVTGYGDYTVDSYGQTLQLLNEENARSY
ncbi:putative F-box domain-containing protein [Rosa chinensis]|uniref:Putative F-box domain-containing protein n=1 Tax=Rosa chinensis TaxID=74649 RepID=A0A2P6QG68_ROSCH|nr:F-box protein CPR1 [Rosa chinensis]XP_024158917.1 F-box protein CPR1 [Rosa chinensis]XP_024158919.1 F-box protein CPR1 [Rosa chinensis]PRQ33159.1 putative F-box domain-containing protein [Rosa chinensis]